MNQQSYFETPHIEFTVVHEKFDIVRPLVQQLFAYSRRPSRKAEFGLRQRLVLWRYRARRINFIGEKDMRIIEPHGHPEFTVLKTPMNNAFLRCLSALLPHVECVEFDSINETKRVQSHGLYVRKAGKILRTAEASIGTKTSDWQWQNEGEPRAWEDVSSYSNQYPSQRQNRETLARNMQSLGFDPVQYLQNGQAVRVARFRG